MSDSTRPWHIYVVPASHFDLGWCGGVSECMAYADEIIREAIDAITGEHPEFRFTVEYALFLKHFLERYPRYFDTVKQLIHEKKLEVCAGMTGYMEQILDGEMLVRQVVMAKHWARETFDIELVTGQHSDLPGHTIQMPQILAKAGVKYVTYSRFCPPTPLFRWTAPDGSSVVAAHHTTGTYGWGLVLVTREPAEALASVRETLAEVGPRWPADSILMPQQGDLRLPELQTVKRLAQIKRLDARLAWEISTLTPFFHSLQTDRLPRLTGEWPYGFYALPACRPRTYQEARRAENALASAEKISVLCEALGLASYPQELEAAWAYLFACHDHNVGGRHGALNDEVRTHGATHARILGQEVCREKAITITTHLGAKLDHGEQPIVVFNPLSWPRTDIVETVTEFACKPVRAVETRDAQGHTVPTQVLDVETAGRNRKPHRDTRLSQVRFLFLAKDVPPLGYKTFYAAPCETPADAQSPLRATPMEAHTPFFKLQFDHNVLRSLHWRPGRRELIAPDDFDFGEVHVLQDECSDLEDALPEQKRLAIVKHLAHSALEPFPNFTGRQWRARPRRIRLVEQGPLRLRYEIVSTILGRPVRQLLDLYAALEAVDLTTTLKWGGKKNTMARLAFPFAIDRPCITYETPFGSVRVDRDEMPNTYPGRNGRFVQKWIDVGNREFGVTLANDHGCAAMQGANVYPILIRTAFSCGTPFYWYRNAGDHTFRHRLVPHRGPWQTSLSFRAGWELNVPLQVCRTATCRPINVLPDAVGLPESGSLLHVDRAGLIVTAVKKPVHGSGYVIRLFDAVGKDGNARLTFCRPLKKAWEVDLLERKLRGLPVHDGAVDLSYSAFGIHTVRVELADVSKP